MWKFLLLIGSLFLLSRSSGSGEGSYPYADRIGKVGDCSERERYRATYQRAADRYGIENWRVLAAQGCAESGFKPDAISYVGAAGIAQLMPGTARDWGLEVAPGVHWRGREFPSTLDPSKDERMDPAKAIDVQARIMARNYEDFGDWPAALGAYRSGRARVSERGLSEGDRNYAAKILAISATMR